MKLQRHKQWLALIGAVLLLSTAAGCAEEEHNSIVLEYKDMVVSSDIAVKSSSEDFEGNKYSGKISSYWPHGSARISASLNLRSGRSSVIETGSYRLMHPDFSDSDGGSYASLYFDERANPELPKKLYSRTGELVLEQFQLYDEKAVHIVYRFNGEFSEKKKPSSGERRYRVSGRLQYHR